MTDDYRGQHTAPTDDGYSVRIARSWQAFGRDFLEHPGLYCGEVQDETVEQLRYVTMHPDHPQLVTIYRTMLYLGAPAINSGDWVSLSEEYAREHGMHPTDEALDWPVMRSVVSSEYVFTDGNDLNECGYVGPDLSGYRVDVI